MDSAASRATTKPLSQTTSPLPKLVAGVPLAVESVRDPRERLYWRLIFAGMYLYGSMLLILLYFAPAVGLSAFILLLGSYIGEWIYYKLTVIFLLSDGIEIGPSQYAQVYRIVSSAAHRLEVAVPRIFVLQGHGIFDLGVARRFTRRGIIVVTSNMMDEFCQRPDSREFMMFVGRELGHIKAGHHRFWFFTDRLGFLALPVVLAWRRRCHFTADRLGLLVCGDATAAVRSIQIMAAGARIAPSTSLEATGEQWTVLQESWLAYVIHFFKPRPPLVNRMMRIDSYAKYLGMARPTNVGTIGIEHRQLRSVPILIIHGRDQLSLLALKDLLHTEHPHVAPLAIVQEDVGAVSIAEKFERLAEDAWGAIALLTPDDMGALVHDEPQFRARQNVVLEIGWAWAKFGRNNCLLLVRGQVEFPSDLTGADHHAYSHQPYECAHKIRSFLDRLAISRQ